MGCHALLQGIFLTQVFNLGLLHCRQILFHLSHQGSPVSSYDWSTIHFLMIYLTKIKDKDLFWWYREFDIMKHSVQFSCSVVSNSLQPHELQHARPPCPSPTAGVYPNPCPLSQWCHPTISSSVVPFSNRSQNQGLFQWVSSLYQVAKVLGFQLQHQSFQWIFRTDFL